MPGTFDFLALETALIEGAIIVRADILDGEEAAVKIADCEAQVADGHLLHLTHGNLAGVTGKRPISAQCHH